MRIAFVGKGGAGKTTASSLFAQHQAKYRPTLAIDADVNMHMAELLTSTRPTKNHLVSEKQPSEAIRTYLRGTNTRIKNNAHFKKSTPPGSGSNLVDITNKNDWLLTHYSQKVHTNLSLITVGTYSEEGVTSNCYHSNLAVLESILSHTVDNGVIVADMVAGTDAFGSTLFFQFDMLVFVVEPTTRSLSVFDQYQRLAAVHGVKDKLFVIANKIESSDDIAFISSKIAPYAIVGHLSRSPHLLKVDKGQEKLDVNKLHEGDNQVFTILSNLLKQNATPMQRRLPGLWELHKLYVSQGFVKDHLGDLTPQIDDTFQYPVTTNLS